MGKYPECETDTVGTPVCVKGLKRAQVKKVVLVVKEKTRRTLGGRRSELSFRRRRFSEGDGEIGVWS